LRKTIIPATSAPTKDYKPLQNVFKLLLVHETHVTAEINGVLEVCLKEKDHTTHNFMQWYVSEQIEEESFARTLNDKLKLVGNDNGALYMFDRDLAASIPAADAGDGK
jgi:ferritin